jgi:hypothetical protein
MRLVYLWDNKTVMVSKLTKSRRNISLALLYLSLPVILFATNPQKLPLPLLMLPMVSVFLIFYTTVLLLLRKYSNQIKISKTRQYVLSVFCAIMPVILVVLASIRQFTFKDVILAIGLVALVSLYILNQKALVSN